MNSEPTAYVVDDDMGVLNSLTWMISQAGIPVKTYSAGQDFLAEYRPETPGCLLLDLRMPTMGGLEVQEDLWKRGIGLPIIFITSHGDVPTCSKAFRSGAFHFMEKPLNGNLLIDHIQKAFERDAQQRQQGSAAQYEAKLNKLAPNERDLLEKLLAGRSLKSIASERCVTVQTVWRHRGGLFQKLGVENESELVRISTIWAKERRK